MLLDNGISAKTCPKELQLNLFEQFLVVDFVDIVFGGTTHKIDIISLVFGQLMLGIEHKTYLFSFILQIKDLPGWVACSEAGEIGGEGLCISDCLLSCRWGAMEST